MMARGVTAGSWDGDERGREAAFSQVSCCKGEAGTMGCVFGHTTTH
jgi:hypothetical protein